MLHIDESRMATTGRPNMKMPWLPYVTNEMQIPQGVL